jgi:hypothetical protein
MFVIPTCQESLVISRGLVVGYIRVANEQGGDMDIRDFRIKEDKIPHACGKCKIGEPGICRHYSPTPKRLLHMGYL